jgi:hypothetical protein
MLRALSKTICACKHERDNQKHPSHSGVPLFLGRPFARRDPTTRERRACSIRTGQSLLRLRHHSRLAKLHCVRMLNAPALTHIGTEKVRVAEAVFFWPEDENTREMEKPLRRNGGSVGTHAEGMGYLPARTAPASTIFRVERLSRTRRKDRQDDARADRRETEKTRQEGRKWRGRKHQNPHKSDPALSN